ncbi:MAG: YvrJ family protein [Clostridia bacterium]|nr:YvrJ family protein [Clostridia bacterium]
MEQVLGSVANLGFPIVVAVFLLIRVEKKLDELTISIYELANVISSIK